jgi:uncharacterized protein (TIGR03032 family)
MTTPSPEQNPAPVVTPDSPEAEKPKTLDLKLSASPSFARLLAQHRLSLLVTTYQAGKLIILRAAGERLNAHFVQADRAMGVVANPTRLAVGTAKRIEQFCNIPSLCAKLPQSEPPQPTHDACYVPRHSHVTGHIDVHEMAFAGDELWFVNTRFSCLCTLDPTYSFAPQWRPPFVKALSGDDRCHLNGLAMLNDRPGYVTAFAVNDEPEGWRPQRTTGGILMEVASGEIMVRGMSMPHSPRLYGNELWVLESGRGTLARVDRRNGSLDTVAEFSGFTRGLDFSGNLAFVGLSQVRQSSVIGGLPLTDRLPEEERFCGIQVLNLSTGQREAFLKFESGVQEIFAVQVLHGIRFPAILEDDDPLIATSYTLSPEALAQVRKD